jgi:hypothetical protein
MTDTLYFSTREFLTWPCFGTSRSFKQTVGGNKSTRGQSPHHTGFLIPSQTYCFAKMEGPYGHDRS